MFAGFAVFARLLERACPGLFAPTLFTRPREACLISRRAGPIAFGITDLTAFDRPPALPVLAASCFPAFPTGSSVVDFFPPCPEGASCFLKPMSLICPPQDVEFGILRLRIIEGFVEEVRFTGEKPGRAGLFDLWSGRITGSRPLKLSTLERNLLLMSDIPGLEVVPSVKEKDVERGAYTLEITLKHSSIGGFANLNNRGTTTVGPTQLYAGVSLNSVLGILEHTRLAVFTVPQTPEEIRYFEIQQDHILNSHGTQVGVLASRSSVDIGLAGTAGKENSLGTRVLITLSHPWIRSRETNLYTTLKFDSFDSDKNSSTSVFDDKIRSVRIGARFNAADDLGGVNWLSAEFSRGIEILHASDKDSALLSRTAGRPDYIKATLNVTRVQKLHERLHLQVSGAGQWSPHTLLSAEEFAIGGQQFGRAYDPADISASQGAAGSLELQFAPPMELPAYVNSVQLYTFYDLGAVWGNGATRSSMASTGGGLRVGFGDRFQAQLEAAQPLTRQRTPGETGSGTRFFFTLSGQF